MLKKHGLKKENNIINILKGKYIVLSYNFKRGNSLCHKTKVEIIRNQEAKVKKIK